MFMFLPLAYIDVKPGKCRQDEDVCVCLATFSISVALLLIFMPFCIRKLKQRLHSVRAKGGMTQYFFPSDTFLVSTLRIWQYLGLDALTLSHHVRALSKNPAKEARLSASPLY